MPKIWVVVENFLLFSLVAFLTLTQASVPLIAEVNFIALYLVLSAIAFGMRQSLISVVLCAGLLVYQQTQLGFDLISSILNFSTLLKAAEYCLIGISVSYVIQQLRMQLQFVRMDIESMENDIKIAEQFGQDNRDSRRYYEEQIREYEVSLPRVIEMTSRLDTLEAERILPETLNILSETLGVEDVAAYIVGRRGGRMRLSFARTDKAAAMGQSPVMEEFPDLFATLEDEEVFVNRGVDNRYPSLASGIMQSEHLAYVFMIWNAPFRKMRLDSVNLLGTLTQMVSAALRRAYQYEELNHDARYVGQTRILKKEAFEDIVLIRRESLGSLGGMMCRAASPGASINDLGREVEKLIRDNDYLGQAADGIYILLSGTGPEGYAIFEKRLRESGVSCELMEAGA